jgi:hypothetical protein
MLAEIRPDRTTDREQMLAKIRADRKADREQLQDLVKAYREDLKSDQVKMIAAFKGKMDARIANIKVARKMTTACQEVTGANPEKIEPNSGEEEAVVEQQEIPNEEVAVHSLTACRSETAASQEATKTEPDPGKMQSVEEHQEIPKQEAAVMPVGGLRKRRRDRNLAAGRRQKPKRRIRASRRLTVACRKTTRRATVAWRKRNVFRRIGTQGNCGPRKRLTAAGIKMTRHTRVAWPKGNFVRKDWTRIQAEQETPKRRNDGKGLWRGLEYNNGLTNRGLSRQLRSKTGIKDPRTGQQLRLGNERTTSMIYRKAIRLEIVKRALGISSVFRKTRKWILWRGRHPPKRKRHSARSKSR